MYAVPLPDTTLPPTILTAYAVPLLDTMSASLVTAATFPAGVSTSVGSGGMSVGVLSCALACWPLACWPLPTREG